MISNVARWWRRWPPRAPVACCRIGAGSVALARQLGASSAIYVMEHEAVERLSKMCEKWCAEREEQAGATPPLQPGDLGPPHLVRTLLRLAERADVTSEPEVGALDRLARGARVAHTTQQRQRHVCGHRPQLRVHDHQTPSSVGSFSRRRAVVSRGRATAPPPRWRDPP